MTADEFCGILDRFHEHLADAGEWAFDHDGNMEDTPPWFCRLGSVWRDLNRECALMKDAERRHRCLACDLGAAGGHPRDDDIAVIP